MEALKEILMIAGVLAIAFIVASSLVGAYFKWMIRKNKKRSDWGKMSSYPEPPKRKGD